MIDQRDFDKAFRTRYEQLYVFALRYVRAEQTCRDIVSECFEQLWARRDQVDAARVEQFLYVMVRNRCIDHLRREVHRQEYVQMAMKTTEYVVNIDERLERQERDRIIEHRLARLDDKARHVLEECYVNGKKYREVAEEMGISEATVNKYMVRALKWLRQQK